MHRDGSVFLSRHQKDLLDPDFYKKIGCDVQLGKPKLKISSADCLVLDDIFFTPTAEQIVNNLNNGGTLDQ